MTADIIIFVHRIIDVYEEDCIYLLKIRQIIIRRTTHTCQDPQIGRVDQRQD